MREGTAAEFIGEPPPSLKSMLPDTSLEAGPALGDISGDLGGLAAPNGLLRTSGVGRDDVNGESAFGTADTGDCSGESGLTLMGLRQHAPSKNQFKYFVVWEPKVKPRGKAQGRLRRARVRCGLFGKHRLHFV